MVTKDARYLQVAFLVSFLGVGLGRLGFDVPVWQPVAIVLSSCGTQWVFSRALRVAWAGWLSPLVTGLGLSLLLRTDAAWVGPLAAAIAIGCKFLVRVKGKHVFNPTNVGLVAVLLLTRHAWVSPSQWGNGLAQVGWLAALGLAVAHRAFRSDVSLAFLGSWVALKAGRVLWLGAPWESLWHQLSSGGLIIFTFFMISDPKTTPDHRVGRLLYAAGVAVLAFALLHGLWWQDALLWALCLASPLTPLIDRVLPAERYEWPTGGTPERKDACVSVSSSLPASRPV